MDKKEYIVTKICQIPNEQWHNNNNYFTTEVNGKKIEIISLPNTIPWIVIDRIDFLQNSEEVKKLYGRLYKYFVSKKDEEASSIIDSLYEEFINKANENN